MTYFSSREYFKVLKVWMVSFVERIDRRMECRPLEDLLISVIRHYYAYIPNQRQLSLPHGPRCVDDNRQFYRPADCASKDMQKSHFMRLLSVDSACCR